MTGAVEALFARQREGWPLLARGVDGLASARTRAVRVGWFEVFLRHIPHRAASTTAPVDRASIERRPCFLCRENLPSEQEGIPFGGDYTVLCNPFPVVERHLTIVHRDHRPQRVDGQLGTMLALARALPGFFVVYNGPECGASAPDHLHLQAGSRALFPIARDVARVAGPEVPAYSRRVLLFRGPDAARVEAEAMRAVEILARVTGRSPEPWCNAAAFHDAGAGFTLLLFPRGKHRPSVFHTGELTVSPASIDLCGVMVVPFERDFERITAADVASIFDEVSLPAEPFRELLAGLERGR